MDNILIEFKEDHIIVTQGNNLISINSEFYTPETAIKFALNNLNITNYSKELEKSNLECVNYYKKKSEEINELLNKALELNNKLIINNELYRNSIKLLLINNTK